MQLQATAKFISVTILSSAIAAAVEASPSYATRDANEVAIVENVSGHVVAFSAGEPKPALLEALDVVSEGTRLDLQANSELRICHYQTRQFLTLRGPLRASISREGVAVVNGKPATAAGEPCAAPASSTLSGGVVLRGVTPTPVSNVSGKSQPVEPGRPTTGSAAGRDGKDSIDSSAGAPGLASAATTTATLPGTATAAIPSTAPTATMPSAATTATIPSGASSPTTAGASRANGATTGRYERRRTQQVERRDELTQRIGNLARHKAPQLQRTADESAGSRKRSRERIERILLSLKR
jgi:hypothetical protein